MNTISDIGGLFASVGSFAAILVAMTSQGDFVTHVTKKLFLAKRYHADSVHDGTQVVASHNVEIYNRLKKNTFENIVDR